MEVPNGEAEADQLEQGLLAGHSRTECAGSDEEDDPVLYAASFEEGEENFVKYQTAEWVMYSLLFVLVWGIGFLMLLYLPIRRRISLEDFRSRKLYVTANAIVYKVTKPVAFPCFGVLRKEKHVVLPSVADIAIEQGYLQSKFGIYSIRIENVGVRKPASDDVKIQGITNPLAFRKAVLTHLANMRSQAQPSSGLEDSSNQAMPRTPAALVTPRKLFNHGTSSNITESVILQKLEEVGSSVKRVQSLIDGQHPWASEPKD